jgi:copper homeostasis protein CutC
MLTKFELTIKEWKRFVQDEHERIREMLASGMTVKNYEEYMRLVGRIEGLRSATDFMAEAEKEVERNY